MISEMQLSFPLLPIKKLFRTIYAILMSMNMGLRLPLQTILGIRINRNQWVRKEEVFMYTNLMTLSWGETELTAPKYFKRLKFSLSKASGKVLELGSGIGTMTRWLSESAHVEHIWAVDAFEEAIEKLKSYNLPKVTPLKMAVEDLKFNPEIRFDTVMICELLEHLYPDEETKMLRSLRPLIHSMTRFVISVPNSNLQDPYHVRSFTQEKFKSHLIKFYGNPVEIDYSSGYSQVAWGVFNLELFG